VKAQIGVVGAAWEPELKMASRAAFLVQDSLAGMLVELRK
jgi:hypothetical protein